MALTKEEKKAKKEAKKLEKLKAEAELKKKLKRDELTREMKAQAMKRGEVDRSWRELMLKIKEPVFRKDIEIMYHVFERVYDKKDHLINYTMKLMDVADDQFQRTVASFCDTIDNTINKFLADLEALSADNDRRTSELLRRGEEIANKIMTDHNTAETHVQLLLYSDFVTSDNYTWTKRGENMVKEDEERANYANERETLRSFLEDNYNVMWEQYKATLRAYVVNTADNQKQVRKLRVKENMMADIIASQGKKIANSDGLLRRLRTELAAYESGTKQAVFRDRRNRHREAAAKLKQNLLTGIAVDDRQLSILVKASDDAVQWLEQAQKKGERILRMAALCRKFETRREKVLPFEFAEPQAPVQTKTSVRRQASDDSLVLNALSTTCGLTRLWHRISKAELAKRALLREKTLLEEENAAIMRKIQHYRDQDVTADTFKCICGPATTKSSVQKPNAVEGTLEMAKYHRHLH